MPAERRERVAGIGIVRVNGQPEELDGPDGRRQPSIGGTSRISREAYVRICERLGVKLPGRLGGRRATAAPMPIKSPFVQEPNLMDGRAVLASYQAPGFGTS